MCLNISSSHLLHPNTYIRLFIKMIKAILLHATPSKDNVKVSKQMCYTSTYKNNVEKR